MSDLDALETVIPILHAREMQAEQRVEAAGEELEAARAEHRDARVARESVERLAGIEQAPAEVETPPERQPSGSAPKTYGPGGMEAVAIALRQSPHPLTLKDLTEAVAQLGWRPDTPLPERAVRAAAARLRRKENDFDFIGKKFVYRPRHIVEVSGQSTFLRGPEDDP